VKLDFNNRNHQLIVAALTNMVEEGQTPHSAFETLEDIKRNVFHALMTIHKERKDGG
jgi:hypothetical protein